MTDRKAREMRIGEAAKRAGVSVRTLRHYDDIGLLSPSGETEAGYRLYDAPAMLRLEQILYFRELGFELGEIREMMDHPAYDEREALRRKRTLLEMKKRQLETAISRIDDALAGERSKPQEGTGMNDYEKAKRRYADEARRCWGGTDAYRESERREKGRSNEQGQAIADGMTKLMRAFSDARSLDPADARAGAGCGMAAIHHGALLSLHGRDPRGPWADVHGGRALYAEHRPLRSGDGGFHVPCDCGVLRSAQGIKSSGTY